MRSSDALLLTLATGGAVRSNHAWVTANGRWRITFHQSFRKSSFVWIVFCSCAPFSVLSSWHQWAAKQGAGRPPLPLRPVRRPFWTKWLWPSARRWPGCWLWPWSWPGQGSPSFCSICSTIKLWQVTGLIWFLYLINVWLAFPISIQRSMITVYFSLKSRVSFHFPQAFRHFWSRLQKCLHETHHNHQIILISHRCN